MVYFRPAAEGLFESLGLAQRRIKRGALGQSHVDEEFGPVGAWEELLGHEREAGHRYNKERDGDGEHDPSTFDAPCNPR